MLHYNDKSIVSGYIKQLLASFNLPSLKVYKTGQLCFKDQYYIYENKIVKAKITSRNPTLDDFIIIEDYYYGLRYVNITKKLEIRDNSYDSYTHKYLGNYLRFLRDYKNIDLMSLYNCYSNELANNLEISSSESTSLISDNVFAQYSGVLKEVVVDKGVNIEDVIVDQIPVINTKDFTFSSSDTTYKIYVVPVTLFKDYTIAIDSNLPVEIICGFYENSQIKKSSFADFYQQTYQKINSCSFRKPFIYTKLKDLSDEVLINTKALENQDTLKLFIKVPFSNNSSIVVLEGNYSNRNDFIVNSFDTTNKNEGFISYNRSVTNYEKTDKEKDFGNVKLISKLQLLRLNTNVSHPFADRLYEYLLDNPVTNIDDIADNVKRVQVSLQERFEYINPETGERSKAGLSQIKEYGIWSDEYQNILYDVAVQERAADECYDILGYVDKDVEKVLGKDPDIYHISEIDPISATKFNQTK